MLLCISCTSESENFLEERLATENFDFSVLKPKSKSLQSNLSNSGVEYGIISLDNKQKVKFWFVSHHFISDKGGTIYEFPNGEKSSLAECIAAKFYFMIQNLLEIFLLLRIILKPRTELHPKNIFNTSQKSFLNRMAFLFPKEITFGQFG